MADLVAELAKGEVDTGVDIVETKNYGSKLKLSSVHFDAAASAALIQLQTFDGAGFTGKLVQLRADANGAEFIDLDAAVSAPALTIKDIGALVDIDGLTALVNGLRKA